MLQSIRDGLHRHKWLGYLVLGALALVFAAWGAYGIVNVGFGNSNYAAEAGGQKISLETARNAWMRAQAQYQQQLGGEIPAAQKSMMQDRLLESLIRDTLLTEHAHDLGYRVTDKDVREAIRSEPAFQVEGQYSADVARERLAQAGISLETFQDELRSALQRGQLENGIAASEFQTPTELERARTLRDEEREIRYAVLPTDKYSANVQVDDAAVQAYYKAHGALYMTPERAHIEYAQLTLSTLAAQVTPSDADLKAAYDKNKNRYVEPERRHAAHILITPGKDDAAAKKQAEDLLAQAKAGKDFAALAKQYSQDPGSAENGGDLGSVGHDQFVGAFGDALFAMKPGEITGPVKTEFGYHIIKLEGIEPAKTKTFDEAKPDLEAQVRRNLAADRFGEIQEALQAKVDQGGGDLDTLAKEYKLETGNIPDFLVKSGAAPFGAAAPLQELVFGDTALPPGKIGGPVVVGDDRLVLVKVIDRHPPAPKPLAEVREAIVTAIRKERGSQMALKAAQDGMKQLEAGTGFDDVAKSLGVSAAPAKFVSRTDTALAPQLLETVFDTPKPGEKPVYRAVPTADGAALLAITKVRTEGPQPTKELQDAANKKQEQLARQDVTQAGRATVEAYVDQLRRSSDVQKNPKAFE